jgi:hypothetical protein
MAWCASVATNSFRPIDPLDPLDPLALSELLLTASTL